MRVTPASGPQRDVRAARRRPPQRGRHRAVQDDRGRADGGGQVRHARVAADDERRVRRQRGELGQVRTAGQHGLLRQTGERGDVPGERDLCHAAGDDDPVALAGQFCRHLGEAVRRPLPCPERRPRVDDHLTAGERARPRVAQCEVLRVGRNPVPLQQGAPPPSLVRLRLPGRPVRARHQVVGVREQTARPGAAQRLDALRAAAVQVDRDVRRLVRHRPGAGHVEQLVDAADQRQQPAEVGRGGQHEVVLRVRPPQRPQRGHRGQQVAEPEPAQGEQDRSSRIF